MGKTQRKEKSLSYIFFSFARPPAQKNNFIKNLKVMTLVKGQTDETEN